MHHFHGVHAGQDHGDLRLIPQPPEGPLGGGVPGGVVGKALFRLLRQEADQLAAPERLHDYHGKALAVGVVQATASGLGMLVHVVVLDLAEVPVPGIDEAAEHIAVAMIGKAHLPDGTALFLFPEPILNAQRFQPVPAFRVCQHVHQVVVHMVSAQAAQLLRKKLFQSIPVFDQIVGQLGGDEHPVPDLVSLQNLSQRRFAAGVDVGGVKIVHAAVDGSQNLPLCLCHVDDSSVFGKAHTAEAQNGQLVSVSV